MPVISKLRSSDEVEHGKSAARLWQMELSRITSSRTMREIRSFNSQSLGSSPTHVKRHFGVTLFHSPQCWSLRFWHIHPHTLQLCPRFCTLSAGCRTDHNVDEVGLWAHFLSVFLCVCVCVCEFVPRNAHSLFTPSIQTITVAAVCRRWNRITLQ